MLKELSHWLTATPVSQFIANRAWITPAVQSVHLLAIAVVVSSALMINVRLFGFGTAQQTLAQVQRRFNRPLWLAAAVLLASGLMLVVGEPARELLNVLFLTKMALVAAVLCIYLFFGRALRRRADAWEATPRQRLFARLLATSSMLLWLCILIAGRWIAYVR